MLIYKTLLSVILICATTNALELRSTFREDNYKHIAFGAAAGGSSHHNWVLSILDNLHDRGHRVSYLTTTKEARFARPFKSIEVADIGNLLENENVAELMKKNSAGTPMIEMLPLMMKFFSVNYERDYNATLNYFQNNNVDLAICDHFMESCVDAARTSKIPFIITSSLEMTSESAAPFVNNAMLTLDDFTTEHQSFYTRFYHKFIVPLKAMYALQPVVSDMIKLKQSLGIDAKLESPEDTWKHALKLVNIYYGYTPARPVGPLAEFVGPIIPKTYNPLTPELEKYLNSHERVAYIGFGQNAIPTKKDVSFILSSLMESLELGYIDGFIWSTHTSTDLFSDTVSTSSGSIYNVQEMFNGTNSHARLMSWVPQVAVLLHPSTSVFVSHGGLASWYESMYAGKPMLMFPFFGDQPGNSLSIERDGLGFILHRDASIDQTTQLFKKATDKNGDILENVKRFQALTQIRSEHSVLQGADVVEEVVYTYKDGVIPQREPINRHMSFIKSHNLDLYAALFFILANVISLVVFIGVKVFKSLTEETKLDKKVKKL